MKKILIAESGGSKTDWCLVDTQGQKSFFSSESYHPANLGSKFKERVTEFWDAHIELKKLPLHFFGAGCLQFDRAHEIQTLLEGIGFEDVSVKSDLHAAGIATLNKNDGWVAILGTGSVLFRWENREVVKIIGGKGHLEGDEGSGYYFGKLMLEKWKNKEFSEEQLRELEICIQHIQLTDKFGVADISKKLSGNADDYEEVHKENIEKFIQTHILNRGIQKLTIVGGYGYYNQALIRSKMEGVGVKIDSFLERPISKLVERLTVESE